MPDFEGAMSSPDGSDVYQGRIGGENIMAVSVAAGAASENLAATRYVVSLEQVDNQILLLTAIIGSVCLAIILFVIFSSSYFINSIVNPVSERWAETARRIAQGDFTARLEKKNDDEIGELCDMINYMAEELSNAEKLKNDFISSVSHELRTPLTAIRGWGETMLMDGYRPCHPGNRHGGHHAGDRTPLRHGGGAAGLLPDAVRPHEAGQEQDGCAGRAQRGGHHVYRAGQAGGNAPHL
ncbi:MAG: histidine kinase dimerization/phospho-acceptor domain-containing protein [Acutalibacteraceae bacterium]